MLYRVQQLWWALTAGPLSAEISRDVQTVLSSAEFALFQRFSHNDQQHSIRVLAHLRKAGHSNPNLLKAALIHDVGKTRTRLTILDRCLIVLASRLAPARAAAWGHDTREPFGLRRAFVTKEQHPVWGADMADAAGSNSQTIGLIRWHQASFDEAPTELVTLLRLLRWADDQS